MSYLSADKIRQLITNGVHVPVINPDGKMELVKRPLVEPADGKARIEGSALDLSLAQIYGAPDGVEALIDTHYRRFPPGEVLTGDEDHFWHLEYGKAYLLESIETLAVPVHLLCRLLPKTSLARSFCQLTVSDAHPGYLGKIHGLITIHNPGGLWIQRGALWCIARWAEFGPGETDFYTGQWGEVHGNRVASGGETIPAK